MQEGVVDGDAVDVEQSEQRDSKNEGLQRGSYEVPCHKDHSDHMEEGAASH